MIIFDFSDFVRGDHREDEIVVCPRLLKGLLVWIIVGLTACTPGRDVMPPPGEFLPGSENIGGRIDSLSISPDGRWLFYDTRDSLPSDPKFMLYDIRARQRHAVGLGAGAKRLAEQTRAPFRSRGCWSADGSRVYLVGSGGHDLFYLPVAAGDFLIRVDTAADRDKKRFYFECEGSSSAGRVSIIRRSDDEVLIADSADPARIHARHTLKGLFRNRIAIQNPGLSPDNRYLAYGVTESLGSFTGPTMAYLLRLDAGMQPRALGPVYGPVLWGPGGEWCYAWSAAGEGGVRRWRVAGVWGDEIPSP